jgi:hypothetical protein
MPTTITILLQQNEEGQTTISHFVGGDIEPSAAANVCRMVAGQFDQDAIEAEVQRRLEAAREEKESVTEAD